MPLTIPILTIMLCLHYTPGTPSLYITDNDNAGGKVLVVLVFSMWVGGPVGRLHRQPDFHALKSGI